MRFRGKLMTSYDKSSRLLPNKMASGMAEGTSLAEGTSSAGPTSTGRASNFTKAEELILAQEVSLRHNTLFKKFNGPGNGKSREDNKAWQQILNAVNR